MLFTEPGVQQCFVEENRAALFDIALPDVSSRRSWPHACRHELALAGKARHVLCAGSII